MAPRVESCAIKKIKNSSRHKVQDEQKCTVPCTLQFYLALCLGISKSKTCFLIPTTLRALDWKQPPFLDYFKISLGKVKDLMLYDFSKSDWLHVNMLQIFLLSLSTSVFVSTYKSFLHGTTHTFTQFHKNKDCNTALY